MPCVTEVQFCPTVNSAGFEKLTPAWRIVFCERSPVELGSGKLGKPCERRHWANASNAWTRACCWAGLASGPFLGLPMMCWQAFCAVLNAGWPEMEGLMPITTDVLPADVFTFGSGKLLTPWLRMHAENWYADWPGPPFADAAEPDTDGEDGELPPQPAASSAAAAAAATASAARRMDRGKVG